MFSKIEHLWDLTSRYDGLLFDAYGVLVDDSQLIPGAGELWKELQRRQIPCWIVTNGSSRTIAETLGSYQAKGLHVEAEQLINSASLLPAYFAEQRLQSKATAVLGTASSKTYVLEAGGVLVDPLREDFDVLVVANQSDYPLLETIDAVLSRILRRHAEGRPCELILTNPDLIYPKDRGSYGITAGSIAGLLEQALMARLGGAAAPRFVRLGKPHPRIFAEAARRAGSRRLLMIGDQLDTDIRGGRDFGLDTLLVGTGLVAPERLLGPLDPEPTYVLASWESSC